MILLTALTAAQSLSRFQYHHRHRSYLQLRTSAESRQAALRSGLFFVPFVASNAYENRTGRGVCKNGKIETTDLPGRIRCECLDRCTGSEEWCAADRGRSFSAYRIAFRALDDCVQLAWLGKPSSEHTAEAGHSLTRSVRIASPDRCSRCLHVIAISCNVVKIGCKVTDPKGFWDLKHPSTYRAIPVSASAI